jgi:hypothetical protein
MDLADVYRIFHPTLHNIHFSQQLIEPSPKLIIILGHKASLSKYKKTEILPCSLSKHNALKLEINNKNNIKNMQTIGSEQHIAQ